ncbi:hypothetical protein Pmar_PMAR010780, partial [Perkinsus marinus ATCC 50983]
RALFEHKFGHMTAIVDLLIHHHLGDDLPSIIYVNITVNNTQDEQDSQNGG